MLKDEMLRICAEEDALKAPERKHAQVIAGYFAMFGRPGGRSDEALGIKDSARPDFGGDLMRDALDLRK